MRPLKRNGKAVRGRWELTVALPAEVRPDGSRRYPKTQRTVSAKGRREAERLLREWTAEIEAHANIDPSRLTVGALCDRWLAGIAHEVRPKTLDFYADIVRLHVKPSIGAAVAAKVRPSDLTRLYVQKREAGLGETSVRHIHSTISACYSWAENEELLEVNPAARIKKRHRPRQAERPVTVWGQAEIVRAVELSEGLLVQAPLVLAAWAGLRDGEICGLQWGAAVRDRIRKPQRRRARLGRPC